jgi:hypothetical protein
MNSDTMMKNLRHKFESMIKKIGADSEKWQLNSTPQHDGSPHVEINGEAYHYVVTERGSEYEREIIFNIDEILYLLIRNVTFDLACKFELKNRDENQDFRYIMFYYEEVLMKMISKQFYDKIYVYHESLLKHPYLVNQNVIDKIDVKK